MAIPSSITIPNLYVPTGLHSAVSSFLPALQSSMQMKQAQEQQGLQNQLAQMKMAQAQAEQERSAQFDPIALQQAQADLAQTQAKTAGMPGQQMQAQNKAQMDMMYKQRTQNNELIKMVNQNPDLLSDPGIAARFQEATKDVSQPLFGGMGGAQGQPQMQGQQQMPGQIQQMPQQGQMQLQQQPQQQEQLQPVTTNVAEQMQFMNEQKNIPADIKNQMIRSNSAKLMIDDVKATLGELQPFFGPENSLSGAVRGFAAEHGLSDDQQGRMYNSLSKKIMATAGEVAAGMTKSRSEATLKEWQDIVDPRTSKGIGFKQVMQNLGALEDIHNINHDAMFSNYPISRKHDEDFYSSRSKKIKGKYKNPRAKDQFADVSLEDIQAERKRRAPQEPGMEQLVDAPDLSSLGLGGR
jgi:hypothetical protein